MRYMPSPLEYYLSTKQILAAQGMNVLIHKAKKMLFWSDHNKDIKQIILENSDEFSFFVDAGAKIGDITKAVASNFINCLCFEPAKKNYQILIQNLAINIQSQNVIPYNFALGSETTTKKFFLSSERNGDNRFFVSSNEKFESYDVQIKKLDDILSSNNINEKITKLQSKKVELEENNQKTSSELEKAKVATTILSTHGISDELQLQNIAKDIKTKIEKIRARHGASCSPLGGGARQCWGSHQLQPSAVGGY